MKNEEPKSMQEIHEIRQKLLDATKDMTPQEMIEYHKKLASEHEIKSGIKLQKSQRV